MNNNTALIIIDIQNDYFDGGANPLVGSLEAVMNAKMVLNHFRDNQLTVVFVQHLATRNNATFFISNTVGAEIHDEIRPNSDEKVVVKHYPNSFRDTDLLAYLHQNDITDLAICGMMTHMCVDATTRAAKDFGFNCTVIGDACATRELQINDQKVAAKDVHNAFLAALNYFYATVTTAKEYING